MSETAQTIEVVEVAMTPDQVLESSARKTADFLNISPSTQDTLFKNLPLKKGEGVVLNKAGFWVSKDVGHKSGFIGFKNEGDLTSNSEMAQEERTEETTHYLQAATNEDFAQGFLELQQLRVKDEKARALAVDHSFVEAQRAKHLAIQELDGFCEKVGIDKTHAPSTQEEIVRAIKIKTGDVNRGNSFGMPSQLSAGEALRVIDILESEVIKDSDEVPKITYQKEQFMDAASALLRISQEESELATQGTVSMELDRKIEAEKRITGLLAIQVEELLARPENASQVYHAFEKAGVPIDSVRFRIEEVGARIQSMPDHVIKETVLQLLSKDLTAEELLNLSMIIPGEWSDNMAIIAEMNPQEVDKNGQLLDQMKTKLSATISETEVKNMNHDPREILSKMMLRIEKVASAQAGVESNLIFLMDDLPQDEKSRANLLSNSQFVAQYLAATLSALKSGEFTPANAKLTPDSFANSSLTAEQVAAETLGVSMDQPEGVAFFQDLASEAAYVRKMGSSPDDLAKYAGWQLDMQLVKDGHDLSKSLTREELAREDAKAQSQSLEHIRLKQEMSKHKHLMDILVEPIAKVVVAQKLGRERSSIRFPDNMMGGYSALLRSHQFSDWVGNLWQFVERVRQNGSQGGGAMLEFFKAKTVVEQKAVVTKYLKKVI